MSQVPTLNQLAKKSMGAMPVEIAPAPVPTAVATVTVRAKEIPAAKIETKPAVNLAQSPIYPIPAAPSDPVLSFSEQMHKDIGMPFEVWRMTRTDGIKVHTIRVWDGQRSFDMTDELRPQLVGAVLELVYKFAQRDASIALLRENCAALKAECESQSPSISKLISDLSEARACIAELEAEKTGILKEVERLRARVIEIDDAKPENESSAPSSRQLRKKP